MSFGLVLSGGSAYGLANAGVLDVFEKHHVKPNVIAGSSMGAIIAALYAVGHNAKTICALAEELSPLSLVGFSKTPLKGGFHGGILRQKLEEHLAPLLGDTTIGETKIPFVCVAGRVKKPILWSKSLSSGFLPSVLEAIEPYIFPKETRILDAIAASSALPVIFSPVIINNQSFVDLCSFGAVPSRSLRKTYHVEKVIGTKATPSFSQFKPFLPPGLRSFIQGAEESLSESLELCDLVITPKISGALYDFQKGKAFILAGKDITEDMWPEIEKLLCRSSGSTSVSKLQKISIQ